MHSGGPLLCLNSAEANVSEVHQPKKFNKLELIFLFKEVIDDKKKVAWGKKWFCPDDLFSICKITSFSCWCRDPCDDKQPVLLRQVLVFRGISRKTLRGWLSIKGKRERSRRCQVCHPVGVGDARLRPGCDVSMPRIAQHPTKK